MLFRFLVSLFVFAASFVLLTESASASSPLDPTKAHVLFDKYESSNFEWKPSSDRTLANLLTFYRFDKDDTSVYARLATSSAKNNSFCAATVRGLKDYRNDARTKNANMYESQSTPAHLDFVLDETVGLCDSARTQIIELRKESQAHHATRPYECSKKDFRPFNEACLSEDNWYVTGMYEKHADEVSAATLLKICDVSHRGSYQYSIAAQYLKKRFPRARQCTRETPAVYIIAANF